MTIYRTVGGVNKEIKQQYRVVGGVNKEITAQYRGVGGVNRKVFEKPPLYLLSMVVTSVLLLLVVGTDIPLMVAVETQWWLTVV